jgi:uncharacterized protein (UPF0332 family)
VNPDIWLAKAERNMKTARLSLADGDPDSACNRAYYCMFNAARAALLLVDQPERAMGKTHNGLVASFAEHLVKPGHIAKEHGRNFALESKRRLLSDYEGQALTAEDAESAIANATAFAAAVLLFKLG